MRGLTIYLVGFVTVCASAVCGLQHANAAPVQWTVGEGGNGHYYEAFVVPEGISWTDAHNAAISKGGYLASITSEQENDFVFSLIDEAQYWNEVSHAAGAQYNGPWVGGRQDDNNDEPAGHWAWDNGDTWSYTNWFSVVDPAYTDYEPNNGGGAEDWLGYMNLVVGGGPQMASTWNDFSNDNLSIVSYVVESVPEPSTLVLLGMAAIGLLAYAWRRKRAA